jgi:hypothetical protein
VVAALSVISHYSQATLIRREGRNDAEVEGDGGYGRRASGCCIMWLVSAAEPWRFSRTAGRSCCHFCSPRYSGGGWGAIRMFDVYLNAKRDLLVVPNGLPIPLPDASGRWRKKKKVQTVSEDIGSPFRDRVTTCGS